MFLYEFCLNLIENNKTNILIQEQIFNKYIFFTVLLAQLFPDTKPISYFHYILYMKQHLDLISSSSHQP